LGHLGFLVSAIWPLLGGPSREMTLHRARAANKARHDEIVDPSIAKPEMIGSDRDRIAQIELARAQADPPDSRPTPSRFPADQVEAVRIGRVGLEEILLQPDQRLTEPLEGRAIRHWPLPHHMAHDKFGGETVRTAIALMRLTHDADK